VGVGVGAGGLGWGGNGDEEWGGGWFWTLGGAHSRIIHVAKLITQGETRRRRTAISFS
jgi:hypothetical protein